MLIRSHRHRAEDLRLWADLEDADRNWGRTDVMARKVDRSLREIRAFAAAGPCYAGISGGADSVALWGLIQMAGLAIPFAHVSAYPLPDPHAGDVLEVLRRMSPEARWAEAVADYSAMPDHWSARDEDRVFCAAWRRIVKELGTDRHLSGVRADESGVRKIRMRRWGLSTDRTCCPLGWWTKRDVFGFLAARDLPTHPAYAMLGGGRWNRKTLRVDGLAGIRGRQFGRLEWEREYYGDVLNRLGV